VVLGPEAFPNSHGRSKKAHEKWVIDLNERGRLVWVPLQES
jgi:hypothetical protein